MEDDGYVYKGRAVAVEVVLHERWAFLILSNSFKFLFCKISGLRETLTTTGTISQKHLLTLPKMFLKR